MTTKKRKTKKKGNTQSNTGQPEPFMIITNTGRQVPSQILEGYAMKSEGESHQITEDPFIQEYGELGLINPLYQPEYLMSLAEVNTYHDVCCDTKANDIAGMGYDFDPVGDTSSNANRERLETFFNTVMSNNPFRKAQRDEEELGYCCVEVTRYADNLKAKIKTINHVPAYTVRIHKEGNKYCQMRGSKTVWFKRIGYDMDVSTETGTEYPLGALDGDERGSPATEMIWKVRHTSKSTYYGRPSVIPAIRAMYGNLSLAEFNIGFFENFGVPAYAVFVTGNYNDRPVDPEDETQGTVLQKRIRDKFQAVQRNPHSTMVFAVPSDDEEGKVEIRFERLSVETKEASFRLYREDNLHEIISAHRMDPHRINTYKVGPLGGDTARESRINYKESVQVPGQESWQNIINTWIIRWEHGFNIQDWRFRFTSFDLRDEVEELNLIKGVFSMGAMSPADIQRKYSKRLGLEVVEGDPAMDAHYINNTPIDLDVTSPVEEIATTKAIKIVESLKDDIERLYDEDETPNSIKADKPVPEGTEGIRQA
jgi:PBSX family phage portal protein